MFSPRPIRIAHGKCHDTQYCHGDVQAYGDEHSSRPVGDAAPVVDDVVVRTQVGGVSLQSVCDEFIRLNFILPPPLLRSGECLTTVTVIVSVYNGAKFIPGCLRYLNEQTHRDLDILFVVDSKTADGSADMIREMTADDPRVRVLMQYDGDKLPGARNIGLDAAVGDYVWCLDVDDRPYPSLVEDLLRIAMTRGVDAVVCNCVASDDLDLPERDGEWTERTYSGVEAAVAVGRGELPPSPWCKLYSMDFIKRNGLYYTPGLCEDLDYTVRAFLRTDTVVYYNRPLYVYYQHANSICGGKNDDIIARRDVELAIKLSKDAEAVHPDFAEDVAAALARHTLRSMTRASAEGFRELSATDDVRWLVSRKQPDFSPEVVLFRFSPRLFYAIGKRLRGRKYAAGAVYFDPKF